MSKGKNQLPSETVDMLMEATLTNLLGKVLAHFEGNSQVMEWISDELYEPLWSLEQTLQNAKTAASHWCLT